MNFTKKMITFVLCLIMVGMVLPMGAFALETTTENVELHEKLTFDDLEVGVGLMSSYFDDHYEKLKRKDLDTKEPDYALNRIIAVADPEDSNNVVLGPAEGYAFSSITVADVDGAITDGTVDISMKLYLLNHVGNVCVPMIRVYNSSGSHVNPFVIDTTSKGSEVTGKGTVFGKLRIANSNVATNGETSDATLYYNTWHDVRLRYTPLTGAASLYLDGQFAMSYTISALTDVSHLIINRSTGGSYVTNYIDDFSICTVREDGINAFNDLNDIPYTPDTDGAMTGVMSGDLPSLDGFTSAFESKVCNVVEEDNGNRYIASEAGATGLSWKYHDENNALYQGKFEISMRFRRDADELAAMGLISLLENDPDNGTSGRHNEMRILHALGNVVYFGPSVSYKLFELRKGQWYDLSVVVTDPCKQTYEIYLDDVLRAYTVWKDADTYALYVYTDGEWQETLNPSWSDGTNYRFPYGYYNVEDYGLYGINLFHYKSIGFSFDDLCIRSLFEDFERTEASLSLYDVDFDSFFTGDVCLECVHLSSAAGLPALHSSGMISRLADGQKAFAPDNNGQSSLVLSLGGDGHHYLEGGTTVWTEGSFSLSKESTPSDVLTFAALERYTENGWKKLTAPLVTVDGTGAVYLLGKSAGRTLDTNTFYTLKVGVNSLTKQVELYIDGASAATATLTSASYSTVDGSSREGWMHDNTPTTLALFTTDSVDFAVKDFRVYSDEELTNIAFLGLQKSTDPKGIRVLCGVSNLDYSKVGLTISLLGSDGKTWEQKEVVKTNTVYTSILAGGETITASELGCRYIIAIAIVGIPDDISEVMCVRPFTVLDGVSNYGEAVSYSIKSSDGGLSFEFCDLTAEDGFSLISEHSFEETPLSYQQYGTSGYGSLTAADGYYKWGGTLSYANATVGSNSSDAYLGEKALHIGGVSAGTSFGGRIKLGHILPDQLTDYIGKTVRISGYVKLDDFKKTSQASGLEDHTGTVDFSFGYMTDKTLNYSNTKTYTAVAGEWFFVEYEFDVTEELLVNNDFALDETNHYPARVCLVLGNSSGFASSIWLDDIKVECKAATNMTLPSVFADGMVLQRNKPINIWGWDAQEGDVITATIGTNTASAVADENGEFSITLSSMEAATDQTLTLSNSNAGSITYTDVNIGEVWYCGGQSNMELKMGSVFDADEIIAAADDYNVRTFKVGVEAAYELQKDVMNGSWSQVTSSNVSSVTGIGYIAAYQLQRELDVPVALIECYQGGSAAQAWLNYERLFAADREFIYNDASILPSVRNEWGCEGRTLWQDYDYYWSVGEIYDTTNAKGTLINGSEGSVGARFAPTGFYNAMQGPLANYAIAGVMWYQGESQPNARIPDQYNYLLYDLIEQWREDFKDENLPVMLVQLAPYAAEEGRNFYEIRQVQLDTAKRLENVGVISTAYEGTYDSNDTGGAIHPGTKVPVGNRMAATILAMVYDKAYYEGTEEYTGPVYEYMEVEGNQAILHFSHIGDGLKIKDNEPALTGFKISGDGTTFVDATASFVGDTVVVTADSVTSPVAVQYAYVNSYAVSDAPDTLGGNLENSIGQPAFPFLATLGDAELHGAKVVDGKLQVEIWERGHNETEYTVVINDNTYTATFETAGNFIVTTESAANVGDSVTVTLKTADGSKVIEEKTVTVE